MSCFFPCPVAVSDEVCFLFFFEKNFHCESKQTIQMQKCQFGSFAHTFGTNWARKSRLIRFRRDLEEFSILSDRDNLARFVQSCYAYEPNLSISMYIIFSRDEAVGQVIKPPHIIRLMSFFLDVIQFWVQCHFPSKNPPIRWIARSVFSRDGFSIKWLSFPSYINSIVSSNDPCNLKWKTALDTESSHMYENKARYTAISRF